MGSINPEKYVLTIVLVVLFLLIFITIWAIRTFGQSEVAVKRFPPWLAPCPDYWVHTTDGRCQRLFDQKNGPDKCDRATAGSVKLSYDVSTPDATNHSVDFQGKSLVDKCRWANKCKVFWEGVSNRPCTAKDFEDYVSI